MYKKDMELTLLGVVAIVFFITAVGSLVNHKYLHYPSTIGVMCLATLVSLTIILLKTFDVVHLDELSILIERVNFGELLLNWMLPVLLFAGALHVPITDLKQYRFQIVTLATVGVIVSALVMGTIIYYAAPLFDYNLSFLQAMVFGVLISSTDPICALGILNRGNVSHALKAKITGEALFNDGTSVVLFLTLVELAFNPANAGQSLDYIKIAKLLFVEVAGGILVGVATAFVVSYLTRAIDAYDIEIMLTLSLAFGSYALASALHVSGPIAVVVAGLYIGNRTIKKFMSEKSREHVNTFWTIIDELLNAVLFVLMGLELMLFSLNFNLIIFGCLAIASMLIARYFSIIGSATMLIAMRPNFKKTPLLMTWAGLRGGISIALALSIPNTVPEIKELIIVLTFMCVFFSVIVQGLTLSKVLEVMNAGDLDKNVEVHEEAPEPVFSDAGLTNHEKFLDTRPSEENT